MTLTYDRPVAYQSHMFGPRGELEHKLNMKVQPYSNDFLTKDPPLVAITPEPSMTDFKHKLVLSEAGPPQLISWTRKHPQHWTRREVLDWIYFVVDQEHLDGSKLQGEAYNNFIGEDLCQMDRKQFLKADPYYGSKMYETFRNLINDVSFEEPKPALDIACLDTFNTVNNIEYAGLNRNIHRGVTGRSFHGGSDGACNNDTWNNSDMMVYRSEHDIKVSLMGLGVYSISPEIELPPNNASYSQFPSRLREGEQFTQPLLPFLHSQLPELSSISSAQSSSNVPVYTKHRSSSLSSTYQSSSTNTLSSSSSRKQSSSHRSSHNPSLSSSSGTSSMSSATLSLSSTVSFSLQQSMMFSSSPPPCRIDKTDPGYLSDDSCSSPIPPYQSSPSLNDISFGDEINMDLGHSMMSLSAPYPDECTKPKKKDKKNRNNATKNGNHLWEFVCGLLRDPEANPKLLKWEDKDNGVFRFVQSEKVAQLWGEKKNNPLMTYEKLSRAMRFCRSAGYFDNVPKTGKFPKKLCFRFGEKARGWKD